MSKAAFIGGEAACRKARRLKGGENGDWMSDDIDTKSDAGQKTERRPLSLRRTEKGAVKQSFSHGRTKTVVVETKRRRITAPGAKPARETEAEAPAEAKPAARQEAPKTRAKIVSACLVW